jgi:hypothetical protein
MRRSGGEQDCRLSGSGDAVQPSQITVQKMWLKRTFARYPETFTLINK